MVAGPELVRITTEFEMCIEKVREKASVTLQHDQTKSTQVTFACKKFDRCNGRHGEPFYGREQGSVKAGYKGYNR